jgi:1-deoxy-D-xylulose-5-phosphate reductoisomerase
MRSISILGSTGSIGCNTLKVVKHLRDEFRVSALAAGKNIDILATQILDFEPEIVSVSDDFHAEKTSRNWFKES